MSISLTSKIYRVKIVTPEGEEKLSDPSRPSWVNGDIKLADHPQTYAGYLARHFYSNTVSLGEELPAWTYDTISSYGFNAASFSGNPDSNYPVPNTLGVYQAQEKLYGGSLNAYKISDIDVLRFWPMGRPGTVGGYYPGVIHNWNTEPPSQSLKTAPTIITEGAASSDCDDPTTALYYIDYLGGESPLNISLRDYAKINPSYGHEFLTNIELYPIVPHLGTWEVNQRDLGMVNRPGSSTTSWEMTTKSASVKYGQFYDKWYQSFSHSYSPGYLDQYTEIVGNSMWTDADGNLNRYPYGCCDGTSGTRSLTNRISIGDFTEYDTSKSHAWNKTNMAPASEERGLNITTDSTVHATPVAEWPNGTPMLDNLLPLWSSNTDFRIYNNSVLLDEIWGGTYYTGGFYIENRGLAYHLRNAVKWSSLRDQPSIGGISFSSLFGGGGSYGRYRDGNYGPIPPSMTFNGGGEVTWSSDPAWRYTFPYSNYLDWDDEMFKLESYYSNTGKFLECEFVDGSFAGQRVYVLRATGAIVDPELVSGQRVCPEYLDDDELFVMRLTIPEHVDYKGDAYSVYYKDLNVNSRQTFTYDTGDVTLEPYYDYFPDTYIPFETNFLLPEDQRIPNYSFNCSSRSGQYSLDVQTSIYGSQGEKGFKGDIGCTSASIPVGSKGDKGLEGSQGGLVPGGKGSPGDKGGKGGEGAGGGPGGSGPQGEQGGSVKGEEGDGIITGSTFGTVVGWKKEYTTSLTGTMNITLGDASTTSNEGATVQFSSKMFGVCIEDASSQPNYTGMYLFATDFIDGP